MKKLLHIIATPRTEESRTLKVFKKVRLIKEVLNGKELYPLVDQTNSPL